MSFIEKEKEIQKFWQENNIFEKSISQKDKKKAYVFYDGPPFATGLPHYGHLVASLMKDAVPRFWTMQGFQIDRKWGWDCHGLPIENIVEKNLNLNSRQDIEKLGVEKFNESCQQNVLTYTDEWKKTIKRFGRWVDMENDYKTMDVEFMESVWWVFKSLWDKDLIYEGYKSMHLCPRCETTLSNFEVGQNYKNIKDLSITVKFKIQNSTLKPVQGDIKDSYILAWTTTPWTLPGNVALAVGSKIDYVKVEFESKNYILAKELLEKVFEGKEYKVLEEFKGKVLEGLKYQPLFDYFVDKDLENKENLYKVVIADFVTTENGTGVVHIAPAFGEDDLNLSKEKDLAFIQHVKDDGRFVEEMKEFADLEVKPRDDVQKTDVEILKYLAKKDLLFSKLKYEHSYPHCWRCETPLINYSTSSWFVKVTALKERMIELNKNIHWFPTHIKEGRFGKWLEGARDWAISRSRYWGNPMPVWKCECGEVKVLGSKEELEKLSGKKVTDLHKQFVDKLTFACEKCSGKMKRIPEVLDCWFESGSMPYGQKHYPFENKKEFEENFPAQFIAEGQDQTRAWFYVLHILSTALFDKEAFKNVIVNGIVLAEDGHKMSKSKKNYPDPMEVIEKYGSDALRYYLLTSPVMKADDLNFSEKGVDEVYKKIVLLLLNVFSFYKLYAKEKQSFEFNDSSNVLDQWIISKVNLLIKEVEENMKKYDLNKAVKPIGDFINELSTWYLRRSRDRFRVEGQDKESALATFGYVLMNLSKVMAPFTPFMAEHLYKDLGGDLESVHLENWPDFKEKLVDKKVLETMSLVREIVEAGLSAREEAQVRVRQPLASYSTDKVKSLDKDYIEIIKDELNIKELKFGKAKLDVKITEELKQEGILRELVRQINFMRKKQGLTINDQVVVEFFTENLEIKNVFEKFTDDLKKNVLAKDVKFVENLEGKSFKVNKEEVVISLN